MEKKESKAIVSMLRKATKIVKIYPFVYSALYLMCMTVYYVGNETISSVCDMLFTITPIMIFPLIGLSRVFKLCKWHRLQCVLLLFPILPVIVSIIVEPSFMLAMISIIMAIIIFILSLINAYFVFVKPKRK